MTANEDEQLVRRAAEAFGGAIADGEIDAYLDLLDDEIEFEISSPMKGGWVRARGHDELRNYLEEMASEYTELVLAPEEVRELALSRFLVLGTWHGRVQGGTRFGTPLAALMDVRDGKVVRLRGFLDEQQALAAI
jgi:ketosteroid isomerase-like protein